MTALALLKGSSQIGKKLVFTGGLGGLLSFFGTGESINGRVWEKELTSTVNGMDREKGLVTPTFNSTWLGGAFKTITPNTLMVI
ncbi:hypothetical protein WEN_01900 [Mycoplasma wenyonii str. Massachusetts]|uniref:Uncharacterized protein n=1 Tax=Mycoplasma wenyonii (strain Massachusetts) TaxID=1197325 RepID=I6Z6F8_MYCWM|nr:hypothetical protein [Mycoplasma wenyonii]AFN65173.1 hypothetical protein WEN_01900 [Mycoplasma wenyonii str. Massachusetts]